MVQRVEVRLQDDLDGGPADETIIFALDGRDWEIDLSTTHVHQLREALRPHVKAARKAPTGTTDGRRKPTAGTTTSSPGETAAIRAWATQHGHPVSTRGRIPTHLRDAYHAATGR
jgi:hypothetical protein